MTANKRNMTSAEMESQVLEKIKHYEEKGFKEAPKIHKLIMDAAPSLCPRLWYGMPGYAMTKDSAVLVYFRKEDEYITFGLSESADLSSLKNPENGLMPVAWFIEELDSASEQKISEIVNNVVNG